MSKHDNLSDRQLIELIFDNLQQLYVVVADLSKRVTSMEKRLTILEVKVDRLIENDNEYFEWKRKYVALTDNHEFRITKLETA